MAKAKASSSQPASDTAAAQWSTNDEKALINFLAGRAAAAGDGCSFKMTTFNEASATLDGNRSKGGRKTPKACQNKWNSVSNPFSNKITNKLLILSIQSSVEPFVLSRPFRQGQAGPGVMRPALQSPLTWSQHGRISSRVNLSQNPSRTRVGFISKK
jgi:hypothetical protein